MKTYGAEEFQKERENLICECIQKACELLLVEEIPIKAKSVAEKVSYIFELEKINKKYHVQQQSIGRNIIYKRIWQNYQKKQKFTTKKNQNKHIKLDEFQLQDKLDILQQDYIEINDENKFLRQQYTKLKKELESLLDLTKKDISKPTTKLNNILSHSSKNTNIVKLINDILANGPVVIVKKDNELIIKNYKNSNQERVIISIDVWENAL